MNITTVRNKIEKVNAAARVVVQQFGHTVKFAKHVAALAIKQMLHLTDSELAEYVGKSDIGRMIGYSKTPNPSVFSKFRERAEPEILECIANVVLQLEYDGKPIRLAAQDSSSIDTFSKKDIDARWGVRTIPKKRQNGKENVETFFGYKLHAAVDAERDIPISFHIRPANRNDKKLFGTVFDDIRRKFRVAHGAKYLADSAFDSSDVRSELRYHDIKDVIAVNGRGHRESEVPKDPDYGNRWSVERFFSRLKEVFGLSKNRFVGIKKVSIHIYSCIIAYLIAYL